MRLGDPAHVAEVGLAAVAEARVDAGQVHGHRGNASLGGRMDRLRRWIIAAGAVLAPLARAPAAWSRTPGTRRSRSGYPRLRRAAAGVGDRPAR